MGFDNGWGSDDLGWLLAFTLIPFVVFIVAPILPPAAVGLFVGWRLPRINIGVGLTAGILVGLAAAMAWGCS